MSIGKLAEAVRKGQLAETTALLAAMSGAERRAQVPELKALRKVLRSEPWSPASREAYPALHAAGAACLGGAAQAAGWLAGSDMRWGQATPAVLLGLLAGREREWLGDLAHRLAARPGSSDVPYALVSGLVRLSGCPVPTTAAYVEGWIDDVNDNWHRGNTLLDRLRLDPYTPELVGALFETEDLGNRLAWGQYEERPGGWPYGIARLCEDGVLDRKTILDACVARLLRGGPAADQRVFLWVLGSLTPTRQEERERVADWSALACEAASPAAAHGQSVLARLTLAGELSARRIAELSAGVLFRPEKKLVRAQLVLLGKVLKRDPSLAPEVLPVLADAFGHADTDLQERALKLVERHLAAAGPGAREALGAAVAHLSPGLRPRAVRLLGLPAKEAAAVHESADVLPPVPEPVRLAAPPGSAAGVAEEVGALLASPDGVGAFERTLDGLVREACRDREGLVEALRPVVARMWWLTADSRFRDADKQFRAHPWGVEVILATLFDRVRTETLRAAVQGGSADRGCTHAALAEPVNARLWEAAWRIRTDPQPFLLATPTWESGRLEAAELVRRLAAYRQSGAGTGRADFAQALLRVARDDGAQEAAKAAAALGTPEGDRLAAWLTCPDPGPPAGQRQTQGRQTRVALDGLPLLQAFPEPFCDLGKPYGPTAANPRCGHWDASQGAHWLAVVPGRRELVAARLLDQTSTLAMHDQRGGTAYLPLLAEADGAAGEAVHLSVAYALCARHAEDRLAAVDALLTLAAQDALDAALLGDALGVLAGQGAVKLGRLADSAGIAADTGAWATTWSVLRETLPHLTAGLGATGAPPVHGLGDLLAVAAECAERSGAQGRLAGLSELAARRGGSRLVTQARRLSTALNEPVPA